MTSEFFEREMEAYQRLFWPRFVEKEGCVFLFFDEPKYRQWSQVMGGDKQKIESIMNHRHIVDILPMGVESPTRGLLVKFGGLLRDAWDAKLKRDFPVRRFQVDFSSDESLDLNEYEITFYQLAKSTA